MAERTEIIKVRVTPEEKELIQAQASGRGVTVSEYVRRGAVQKLARESLPPLSDLAAVVKDQQGIPDAIPLREMFYCPAPGCSFAAHSQNAICGEHGRKVKVRSHDLHPGK